MINKSWYPKKPIINPEIKAPKATPNGRQIVSIAPASSGFSFNLWEIKPDLPELQTKAPAALPRLISKTEKKFKNGKRAPNKIEKNPAVIPPWKIFFLLSHFPNCSTRKTERGRNKN